LIAIGIGLRQLSFCSRSIDPRFTFKSGAFLRTRSIILTANSAGSQSGFICCHADDPASIYKERPTLRNDVVAATVSIEHAKERNLIVSFVHSSLRKRFL
jgi:hypothetical protein